jgi:hypothetical protein
VDVSDKQTLFSGRGLTDWFSVENPAAGALASFTVGGRNVQGLRVLAARVTITTDANVANRVVALDFIDARAVTRVRNAPSGFVAASQTNQVIQWDQAHTVSDWNTGTMAFVPLVDVILTPGWKVQLTVDAIQAGDQLSAVSFVVEAFYAD